MAVCVLDKRGKPLMPCTEKRARLLQRADGYGYQQIAQHKTEEAGTRVA